jgi:hypothetical protein
VLARHGVIVHHFVVDRRDGITHIRLSLAPR